MFTKRVTKRVNDVIITTGTNKTMINEFKSFLHATFSIKDLGPIKYYHGIEVVGFAAVFHLSQRKYAMDLLASAGLTEAKPLSIPFDPNKKLLLNQGNSLANASLYRQLEGKLIYLTITRPNLSYAAQVLSKFV